MSSAVLWRRGFCISQKRQGGHLCRVADNTVWSHWQVASRSSEVNFTKNYTLLFWYVNEVNKSYKYRGEGSNFTLVRRGRLSGQRPRGGLSKGLSPSPWKEWAVPRRKGSAPPQKIFQKFEVRVHFGAVLQHLWMFLVEISLRLTLLLSLCSIPNVSYWDIASYYWQACVLVVQKSVFRHAGATHCQITCSSGQKCGNTAPKNSQNF